MPKKVLKFGTGQITKKGQKCNKAKTKCNSCHHKWIKNVADNEKCKMKCKNKNTKLRKLRIFA